MPFCAESLLLNHSIRAVAIRSKPFGKRFFSAFILTLAVFVNSHSSDRLIDFEDKISGYWIWAGLTLSNKVAPNKPLYIYQGMMTSDRSGSRFVRKGLFPHPLDRHPVFLALRLEGQLPHAEPLVAWTLELASQWRQHGTKVAGIQLDFDSATAKLLQYSLFLKQMRHLLPKTYSLSITGLGDWVANGERSALESIMTLADEVVFQLYQGRKPLQDIKFYIDNLIQLNIPYKVGLLDHPDHLRWLNQLSTDRHFQGAVLFLQR